MLVSALFTLLTTALVSIAAPAQEPIPLSNELSSERELGIGFFDPSSRGGSMLDHDSGSGLGEPLNVIISALSTPDVLTEDGLVNFAQAIGFSNECLDLHLGAPQTANLGDGNGSVNQTVELRMDFGDEELGTCLESLLGGNHFRVWMQNGPLANSGAVFLAVSHEENVFDSHTISPDGYNMGRDQLVAAAVGIHENDGVRYNTTSNVLDGLMAAGSDGVNHGIAVDGKVMLLTVKIL